jgi:UDP-glucose 4-epimerase
MALLNDTDKLRVFVTGHGGFVGSNLIKQLKHKIQIITTEQSNKERINILDRNRLNTVENIDVIIHLASKTSIPDSVINPYDTYLTNIVGTLNVLDFARQNNINKIINLSTFVYGKPHYFPIDEKHPINPHSPYTKSKLIAEELCEYYSEDYGIDIVTLRPFYIYGPSMNKASFIPSIIKHILEKGKAILSNKNTKRDFLYIDDFCDLIERILSNFPTGYKTYNVGYGKSTSLEHVVELVKNILQIEVNIEYSDSFRPNDIVDMVADISTLRKLYGWRPVLDIEAGLRLILNDMVDMNIK